MEEAIQIDYTNWKGKRGMRTIVPRRIFFGNNEFHQGPQWLMEAYDLEKEDVRTFAIGDIHGFSKAAKNFRPFN